MKAIYALLVVCLCALFTSTLASISMVEAINAAEDDTIYCNGKNISMTIKDSSKFMCPFGHLQDNSQGRCIGVGDIISKFLGTRCTVDSECALGTNQVFVCDKRKCVYSNTRLVGDSCEADKQCRGYSSLSSGCDQDTRKCVVPTDSFTSPLGETCNYLEDGKIVRCVAPLNCDSQFASNNKECRYGRERGENCGPGTQDDFTRQQWKCRTDLYCHFNTTVSRRTCADRGKVDEICYSDEPNFCVDDLICFQRDTGSSTRQCTAKRASGQSCYMSSDCATDLVCGRPLNDETNVNLVCQPRRTAGQRCEFVNCATGLSCVNNTCRAGDLGDECDQYTCKSGLACGPNGVCIERGTTGSRCNTTEEDTCALGTHYCYEGTCRRYSQKNEECDPSENMPCLPGLTCSRGICIEDYSVRNGGRCASNSDCVEGICDNYLKVCTRYETCKSNNGDCQCICSAGLSDLGTCFNTDVCDKYRSELNTCVSTLGVSLSSSEYLFLDTRSKIFSECATEFRTYQRCIAKTYRVAAPFSPLESIPGYDFSGISSASRVVLSVVAVLASAFALLL